MDPRRKVHPHRGAGNHHVRLTPDLAQKFSALRTLLKNQAPGTIAVSGGLDSRLLAFIANSLSLDYACIHFTGPHVAQDETSTATAFLGSLSLPWKTLDIDPLSHPAVAKNTRDRCYHCKHTLFSAAHQSLPKGHNLLDGTNASDLETYRPGLKALAELGVLSPFAQCGFTKPELYELAKACGLPNPDQPSTPCLLTRLPYDQPVTSETLQRIAQLESDCRAAGFEKFRVRLVHGRFKLFASARYEAMGPAVPEGLDGGVAWTEELSGYWDKED